MRTRATSPHEIDTKWGLDHLAHSSRNDRPALASNGRLLNISPSAGYPLLRSSFGKPIDMTHAVRPVQWFLFVVLTTSIVSTYCWLMGRLLPPLRNEPFSLLLLPMTAISGVIASLVYPVLHHQQSRSGRVLWMYLAFLASLVLYGLYLWWFIPGGTVGLIVLAMFAGHMYGLPAFLAVVLASSVMNRFLFRGSPTKSRAK